MCIVAVVPEVVEEPISEVFEELLEEDEVTKEVILLLMNIYHEGKH